MMLKKNWVLALTTVVLVMVLFLFCACGLLYTPIDDDPMVVVLTAEVMVVMAGTAEMELLAVTAAHRLQTIRP